MRWKRNSLLKLFAAAPQISYRKLLTRIVMVYCACYLRYGYGATCEITHLVALSEELRNVRAAKELHCCTASVTQSHCNGKHVIFTCKVCLKHCCTDCNCGASLVLQIFAQIALHNARVPVLQRNICAILCSFTFYYNIF